ncbi:MAG: NAD-dependent epimerase/dehydratase family protein [Deltaproteobacteria bacterium]|nr:NAD-dependent epimerase/dehydratase family protein [Deltaproteobacteria bacterium]
MHKTILLTGGAGFVGSNLALFLKRDFPATKVIVLDNLKRRGSELNIERFKKENIVYVHGDLRNPEDIANTGPFDLLIDCAAEPSVMSGYQGNTQYVVNTNLNGTVNCLEVLKNYKADLIFLSSSRVYPFQKINALKYKESNTRFDFERNQAITGVSELGISEAFPLDGARTLYGATKLASELMIEEYCDMFGLKAIINRCGVLTGPWQFGKIDQGIIVLWLAKHFYKSTLSYIGFEGSGKQVRDILHIEDLYSLLKIQIQNFNQHSGKKGHSANCK